MNSSDVGLEEDTLVHDPSLPVCYVLSCLARLGLGQLDVVIVEAGDPLVLAVVDAVDYLGLFSNQVFVDFSALAID